MKTDTFKEFVEDQLRSLESVRFKAMFGGYGIYQGSRFFGILFKGKLYFKTGPETVKAYRKAGMKPFRPSAQMTLKN